MRPLMERVLSRRKNLELEISESQKRLSGGQDFPHCFKHWAFGAGIMGLSAYRPSLNHQERLNHKN